MFSKTLLLDACILDDDDIFFEDNDMIDIMPKFVTEKALIPLPSIPTSIQSSTNSSRSALSEIDLNMIRTRLDIEFSDSGDVCERRLVTLNGETNVGEKVRKPYESAVRKKNELACIPIKERRLSKTDLEKVELLKCNCKKYCCMSFSQSEILVFRQHVYTMNQKDRKEYIIRDLLKNGTRTNDTFDFKYFLHNKEVRIFF